MALEAGRQRAGGAKALLDAGLDVTEAAIEGRQLGTQVEDDDVHGLAALKAEPFFSCFDHDSAKTVALVCGVYGELAQISARAADLSVNTGEKLTGGVLSRSEERRVGKECRSRWS